MKIVVLSDIHSNREALEAVWAKIEKIRPDAIFHLGDLAGYGADPEFCVRFAMERFPVGVRGNHDAVACGRENGLDFNGTARLAALFSREKISGVSAKYLAELPRGLRLPPDLAPATGGAVLAHGAPSDPDKYILDAYDALEEIPRLRIEHPRVRTIFIGHTHQALSIHFNEEGEFLRRGDPECPTKIGDSGFSFVNVGSVGQPRDGDPRACFAVLDGDSEAVEWIRVEYDVEKCQHKILSAGLPEWLARRLPSGI